jgi:hypothetical protein
MSERTYKERRALKSAKLQQIVGALMILVGAPTALLAAMQGRGDGRPLAESVSALGALGMLVAVVGLIVWIVGRVRHFWLS